MWSRLYEAGSGLIEKCTKARQLPANVISIGNITWGGTGKTPMTEYIAHFYLNSNYQPLILTRGYSPDESNQLKHHVSKARIGIGRNRYKTALNLWNSSIDIVLLDDGMQHWRLSRQLEITMINALNPFGNGYVIPNGILRQPLSALQRSDVICIHHADLLSSTDLTKLQETIQLYARKATTLILHTKFTLLQVQCIHTNAIYPLEKIAPKKLIVFSGIGNAESLKRLLLLQSFIVVDWFEFPDHHSYSKRDIVDIQANATSDTIFLTTEKDMYRSQESFQRYFMNSVFALHGTMAIISNPSSFHQLLLATVSSKVQVKKS